MDQIPPEMLTTSVTPLPSKSPKRNADSLKTEAQLG